MRCALNLGCIAVVYVPFYLAFIRHISREGLEQIADKSLLAIMVVVMLGIIGFDLIIKDLGDQGLGLPCVAALRGFHGLACILTYALEYELLVSRRLQMERQATERLLAERERQYQRSRENVEAINVKCHDICHQIRRLADGSLRIDPTALGFMAPADIYAFFGNALDNAIEAVEAVGDPARRSISLVVRSVAGVVSVHVENYFDSMVTRRGDGTFETSKADGDNHGWASARCASRSSATAGRSPPSSTGGRFT